jgi:hypothetical protein
MLKVSDIFIKALVLTTLLPLVIFEVAIFRNFLINAICRLQEAPEGIHLHLPGLINPKKNV